MNRYKAAFVHLLICCAIALALWFVMRYVWYPSAYFQALGGAGLVLLLVGVDVVIGPLLTLVVYKPGKKNLKLDLAIIALLQMSALIYGAHVVFVARPVYLVFSVDRFEIISASDIDEADLEKARLAQFKSLPVSGPQVIAVTLPTNENEKRETLFSSLETGKDISRLPKFYIPLSEKVSEVIARAKDLNTLGEKKHAVLESIRGAAAITSPENSLGYLPVRGKRENATAIVDRHDGRLLTLVSVDPWS